MKFKLMFIAKNKCKSFSIYYHKYTEAKNKDISRHQNFKTVLKFNHKNILRHQNIKTVLKFNHINVKPTIAISLTRIYIIIHYSGLVQVLK